MCIKPWYFSCKTPLSLLFTSQGFYSHSLSCFTLLFHTSHFVLLHWLNSAAEFNPTNDKGQLEVAVAGGGSGSGAVLWSQSKSELDKEERGKWVTLWFWLSVCRLLVCLSDPAYNQREHPLFPLFTWTMTLTELKAHCWDKRSSQTGCVLLWKQCENMVDSSSLSSVCWAQIWSHLSRLLHYPVEVDQHGETK